MSLTACVTEEPAGGTTAAALDAALVDAVAIDAAPWPGIVAPAQVFKVLGTHACIAFGDSALAVGTGSPGSPDNTTTLWRNASGIAWRARAAGQPSRCAAAFTHDGNVLYTFTTPSTADPGFHLSTGANLALTGPAGIVAADPGGGALVVHTDDLDGAPPLYLRRLTSALAVDTGFGTAGSLAVAAPPRFAVVQGESSAPLVTAAIDDRLVRLDMRTGAAAPAFGGITGLALGFAPSRLQGIGALPALGVALVEVDTFGASLGPTTLTIHRITAAGVRTSQTLTRPLPVRTLVIDSAGRAIVDYYDFTPISRLERIDLQTGATDTTFGTGGRLSVHRNPPACERPWSQLPIEDSQFLGVYGDGRLAFRTLHICQNWFPSQSLTYSAYHAYDPD